MKSVVAVWFFLIAVGLPIRLASLIAEGGAALSEWLYTLCGFTVAMISATLFLR